MANLIITYWRDIPSQVAVKLGRKEEKRMLDNRFMEAIDSLGSILKRNPQDFEVVSCVVRIILCTVQVVPWKQYLG